MEYRNRLGSLGPRLFEMMSKRNRWKGVALPLGSIVLVGVVAVSIGSLARKANMAATSGNSTIASKDWMLASEPDHFLPQTEADRQLEKMLVGKEGRIDLALANWLVAADVPEFRAMTRESYFARLDTMTEQVRQDMAGIQRSGWSGADPTVAGWRSFTFQKRASEPRVNSPAKTAQSKAIKRRPSRTE